MPSPDAGGGIGVGVGGVKERAQSKQRHRVAAVGGWRHVCGDEGAWVSAVPGSASRPRQPCPTRQRAQPQLLLPSQPYLVHPTEHGHELAEDSGADAGNVDKRALGERRGTRGQGQGAGWGAWRHSWTDIGCSRHCTRGWKYRREQDRGSAFAELHPREEGG